jgi:L-iditol 2-dehydrogenase
VPRKQVVPLPDGFTPLDAVMLEPLGVAVHAVDLAKPRLLETAAVIGCGPIGLLVLQVLRAGGSGDILAVDPQPHRQQMTLGATYAGSGVSEVVGWTGGAGAPLVVEATNSPNGFRDAARAASIGGRLVLVGIPDGDSYVMPTSEICRRALGIKFSRRIGYVYPRHRAAAIRHGGRHRHGDPQAQPSRRTRRVCSPCRQRAWPH